MAQQSAIEAVLTAVYAALNVAGFTAVCAGGVHNGVPQSTAYPYTRIGEVVENRDDYMSQPGKGVLVRLHVFSQTRSDLETARIVSKAYDLLHYAALTVSGHVLVCSQMQQTFAAGTENIAGVETRHHVAELLVTVRQS